jgi:hypothetical protein
MPFRCDVEDLFDPLDHEHFALDFDLSDRLGVEVLERHLTRCQRARKGAEQSATRCGDHVVERGVVGFYVFRGDAVVICDLAVDAEHYRIILNGQIRVADLTLHRLHLDLRDVLHS